MKKAIGKIFSVFKKARGNVETRATTEGGADKNDDSMEREMARKDTNKLMKWLADKDGRAKDEFNKEVALAKVFPRTDADFIPVVSPGAHNVAMDAESVSMVMVALG